MPYGLVIALLLAVIVYAATLSVLWAVIVFVVALLLVGGVAYGPRRRW